MSKKPLNEYLPNKVQAKMNGPKYDSTADKQTRLTQVRDILRGDMPMDEFMALMKKVDSIPGFNEMITERLKRKPASPKKDS